MSVAAGKSGTSGRYIKSPWINTPVKLFISKDVVVEKFKIYRRPLMAPPSVGWEYTGDSYSSTTPVEYLEVKKVN